MPVGEIELLDPAEREDVLVGWNVTVASAAGRPTLVSSFDAAVRRSRDAVAVSSERRIVDLRGVRGARANRLARRLIGWGSGPESLVAVAMRRSVDLLVAVYAVRQAGAAYVPVDPDHPAERTRYILEIAAPVLVLTTGGSTSCASARWCRWWRWRSWTCRGFSDAPVVDGERIAPLRAANTAYVIFTSGSTGRPKGVAVAQRDRESVVVDAARVPADGSDVVLWKTPVTFDVSVWELFWALQVGARLVVAAPDGHRDPAYLVG